jgi:hypothetical protein
MTVQVTFRSAVCSFVIESKMPQYHAMYISSFPTLHLWSWSWSFLSLFFPHKTSDFLWRFHINFWMSTLPRNGSKWGCFYFMQMRASAKWIPKVQKHQGWIGVDAGVLFPALILAIDMGIHNILYGNVSVCAVSGSWRPT